MIAFEPIGRFPRGTVHEILSECYREAINRYDSENKDKYFENWKNSDIDTYNNLDTVGKCCWITCVDGKVAGFFSYDPRHCPDCGIIGQNCILPEFRGKGLGKRQVEKILAIFKAKGCKKVKVTTSDNPFYISAQKMYERCGFEKTGSHYDELWGYKLIDYEINLIDR